MIKFYNTLSRKKETFKTVKKGEVKIYSCGPTVYSYAHIGNLRAIIFTDVLKRTLRHLGYKITDVVNITDVGHLVSDDDYGEDKMLKAAKKEKKNPYEIARFYETDYKKSLKELNIKLPKYMPRATEHVEEQIEIIKKLEKNGFTYKTSDGIYFDVSKLKDYGQLSGQSLDEKKSRARVKIDDEKRNSWDFALWKFLTGDNKNHIMKWNSPWGEGFPGWHIECSAMGYKYLGSEFDIHTGGADHIPIHHPNEIAQNKGSKTIKKINFWMHNAFALVNSQKMAKSLGNIYTLKDLEKKGYNPLSFREMCLRTHYRKQLNFTFKSLKAAQSNLKKLSDFNANLKIIKPNSKKNRLRKIYEKYTKEFNKALSDDLNTPVAMASVYNFMNEFNKLKEYSEKDIKLSKDFMKKTNEVLALMEDTKIPKEIIELAQKRKKVREKKDYKKSDKLRDEIKEKGYEIKDSEKSKEGHIITKL